MNGLSIHYSLATTLSDAEAVRNLVCEMRQLALRQSVERVGPVIEVVKPHPIICFPVMPGKGCEIAAIGFCKLRNSWQWSYACCTHPAIRTENGGVENFLRSHLALIGLLDAIKQGGAVKVEAKDDGGYWQHRDQSKLAEVAQAWNGVGNLFSEDGR
jgi:hypothetical protein